MADPAQGAGAGPPALRTVRIREVRPALTSGSREPEPSNEETGRSDLLTISGSMLADGLSWP